MTMEAFQRLSLVKALDVDVTAADCTPPAIPGVQNSVEQYVFCVDGAVTVWVAINATAAIPVSGGTGTGFPIQAGATVVESVPPNATVSAIAGSPGSTLYVMSGKGV